MQPHRHCERRRSNPLRHLPQVKLDYFVASLLVVTERPVEKAVDSLWKTG
jgi:hypothetical protein